MASGKPRISVAEARMLTTHLVLFIRDISTFREPHYVAHGATQELAYMKPKSLSSSSIFLSAGISERSMQI
jgi:hypothetical protein